MAEKGSVEITHRLLALGVSLAAGLVFLMVLHFTLEGALADFLLDRSAGYYPFTVQNAMWLVFFVGAGEIWIRHLRATREGAQIGARYLPEDPASMLRADDLAAVYSRVRPADGTAGSFLQRLIMRCILQFQSSRSIDQTNSLLNSSLELYQHEIDVDYSMLRYIVWLIPTLGFIGTVVGIILGLEHASALVEQHGPQYEGLLPAVTGKLGVAFNTTLLALLQSAVLVFALHVIQSREEMALNRAGQYCLDNLINRLYEK